MLREHEKENRSNTTFWNRLIPYCWEETLSGQQYIIGQRWWREVRRQTFLHDLGHKIHGPIFVTFDEAEKFFSKSRGQEMGFSNMLRSWSMAGTPGYGKTHQWM